MSYTDFPGPHSTSNSRNQQSSSFFPYLVLCEEPPTHVELPTPSKSNELSFNPSPSPEPFGQLISVSVPSEQFHFSPDVRLPWMDNSHLLQGLRSVLSPFERYTKDLGAPLLKCRGDRPGRTIVTPGKESPSLRRRAELLGEEIFE